jgi:hypothetical protein
MFFSWDPNRGPVYVGDLPDSHLLRVHTFIVRYVLAMLLTVRFGVYRLDAFPPETATTQYKIVRYRLDNQQ